VNRTQINLKNYFDICYSGPVLIGSQEFDVVYDTGSDWLVIESDTCTDCTNAKFRFDANLSKDFKTSDTK